MQVYKLTNRDGGHARPACYNRERDVSFLKSTMYHYGQVLGRLALSQIDASDSIHVGCYASDLDSLAGGLVDEFSGHKIAYSLYWPSQECKKFDMIRHHLNGKMNVCVVALPILNQAIYATAMLHNLDAYCNENIILVTPAIVGDSYRRLKRFVNTSILKRLEVITFFEDSHNLYENILENQPAVLDGNTECNAELIDRIRQTVRLKEST